MPALNWTPDEIAELAAVNRTAVQRALVWWQSRATRHKKRALETATPERPLDRRTIDRTIGFSAAFLVALSRRLQSREIQVEEWQLTFAGEIIPLHLAMAGAAAGGLGVLTLDDTGRVEQRTQEQLEYLRNFALGIAVGDVLLDGRLLRRAEMYAEAGRGTYYGEATAAMARGGFDLERSIRTARDSCHGRRYGCVEQEALGWVPIGTLVLPGGRICMTRCRCYVEYQNSRTGETVLR